MIPQEKSEAVTRGLREAFGVTEFEDISRITRGQTSSLVFRIVVGRSPYLLKIITRAEDPARHYTSMKAAAEQGMAPRVLYTNIEDHVSITDFVDAEPLPRAEALVRLPALLRRLHDLPPFGRAPFNTTCTFLLSKGPALDGFLEKFQAANLLPKTVSEEFFARYAEVAAVYPYDDAEMVSSHNDLFKPDNILFDGQRVLLVDWEAAFLNDRYVDLAAVANQVVANDEEEMAYLQEYFGRAPDEYQRARFHLMQQMSHLFYTMAFLWVGSPGKMIDWSGSVPEFTDYHRRIWAGEVDLSDPEVKSVYARVHWERLFQNVQAARYQEALRIVSGRH
jgi:aminoglycoside phosphotransferase (APT) family kinase protein